MLFRRQFFCVRNLKRRLFALLVSCFVSTATLILHTCEKFTRECAITHTSQETINQMRNELLQLPDLLAVQPFPPSFNTVGWFSSALSPVLGTSVYRFPEGKGVADLKVDDECVLRVLCEPADLSNSNSEVAVRQSGSVIATFAPQHMAQQCVSRIDFFLF